MQNKWYEKLLSLAAPNLTLVNLTIRFSIGYKIRRTC
jgi:hypothetical protein